MNDPMWYRLCGETEENVTHVISVYKDNWHRECAKDDMAAFFLTYTGSCEKNIVTTSLRNGAIR